LQDLGLVPTAVILVVPVSTSNGLTYNYSKLNASPLAFYLFVAEWNEAQSIEFNFGYLSQAACRLLLGGSNCRRKISDVRLGDSGAEAKRGSSRVT